MNEAGLVAIVTRTRDRPFLLRRAVESVLCQTYPFWVHIIVNDGGNVKALEKVITPYLKRYGDRLLVIHNQISRGMEAASNVGIRAIDSEYVVIHDDDDSWSPTFLEESVNALQGWRKRVPTVKGVVTHCARVVERIEGGVVWIEKVEPFNQHLEAGLVRLDLLLHQNQWPPIAFLYKREVFEELGGYREDLPVLGDWDFNIRFLLKYDIAVHPVTLAFYHHRPTAGGALANTVIGGVSLHKLYRQMLLNEWLRQDLCSGRFGIGAYVNLREHLANVTNFQPSMLSPSKPEVTLLTMITYWWSHPRRWELTRKFLYVAKREGLRKAWDLAKVHCMKGG